MQCDTIHPYNDATAYDSPLLWCDVMRYNSPLLQCDAIRFTPAITMRRDSLHLYCDATQYDSPLLRSDAIHPYYNAVWSDFDLMQYN